MLEVKYVGKIHEASPSGDKGATFDQGNYEFKHGGSMVISGLDNGCVDMCVGEQRTVTIPANMGSLDTCYLLLCRWSPRDGSRRALLHL